MKLKTLKLVNNLQDRKKLKEKVRMKKTRLNKIKQMLKISLRRIKRKLIKK
jgi:hypothetical protein